MKSASEALIEAASAALGGVEGLNGVYDGPPLHGAFPYGILEAGPESDWSHKSGAGRELRLAMTIRDQRERPARLRGLVREAETALEGLASELQDWRLVTLAFVRSRLVRGDGGWTAASDFRARMLKT
jgi:uncharacterized protein DUF3168